MRFITFCIIMLSFINNSKSQKTDNDTIFIKKVIKSSWAIKVETGILFNQRQNQFNYIDNLIPIAGVSVFYKNWFFYYDAYSFEFKPKQNVVFEEYTFDNKAILSSFTLNAAIGYIYDINRNWGVDMKLGLNTNTLETSNSKEIGYYYESDFIGGTRFGLELNRYIKLKRFNFIVISLAADYYSVNYKKISNSLNNSFMNYSLTVGYKGWFRKIIE